MGAAMAGVDGRHTTTSSCSEEGEGPGGLGLARGCSERVLTFFHFSIFAFSFLLFKIYLATNEFLLKMQLVPIFVLHDIALLQKFGA